MRERCCQLVARAKGSTFIHLNGSLFQAARGTCNDNLQFAVTHGRHARICPASFGLKLEMNGIHRHRTQSDLTREFGPLLFYSGTYSDYPTSYHHLWLHVDQLKICLHLLSIYHVRLTQIALSKSVRRSMSPTVCNLWLSLIVNSVRFFFCFISFRDGSMRLTFQQLTVRKISLWHVCEDVYGHDTTDSMAMISG